MNQPSGYPICRMPALNPRNRAGETSTTYELMTGTMPEHRHQPTRRRITSMVSVSASEKSPTMSAETARNTENIIRRP